MRFAWGRGKALANRRKHGVSFREAADLLAGGAGVLELYDDRHSDDEHRFIAIGRSRRGVLVVVFAEAGDEAIRIVSARFATRSERRMYRDAWRRRGR